MAAPPPVAVAVVSWNTRALLATCLASLAADAESGLADVWVVDNASGDGSPAMVRERFPWARLLETGGNLGFGPAVNLAAAASRSPWLAPANADVRLEPGALAALLAAGAADPRAGALGPRLLLPGGATQASAQPFPTFGNALALHARLHRLDRRWGERLRLAGYWDPDRAATVDWLTGAFLLVRRTAWDQVGGFDERQWLYAEDLDLGWRLARAGWASRYVPAARVHHEVSAAARERFGESLPERMSTATYAWMLRRRGWAATRATAVLNLAEAGARWAVSAALASRRPGWAGRRDAASANLRTHRSGLLPARVLRGYR